MTYNSEILLILQHNQLQFNERCSITSSTLQLTYIGVNYFVNFSIFVAVKLSVTSTITFTDFKVNMKSIMFAGVTRVIVKLALQN